MPQADVRHQRVDFVVGQLNFVAGNRLQLVQRSTGDAQPSARHHRHFQLTRGQGRSQRNADLVADAASRVFVDHGAAKLRPEQPFAAVTHRHGQRGNLPFRHS